MVLSDKQVDNLISISIDKAKLNHTKYPHYHKKANRNMNKRPEKIHVINFQSISTDLHRYRPHDNFLLHQQASWMQKPCLCLVDSLPCLIQ